MASPWPFLTAKKCGGETLQRLRDIGKHRQVCTTLFGLTATPPASTIVTYKGKNGLAVPRILKARTQANAVGQDKCIATSRVCAFHDPSWNQRFMVCVTRVRGKHCLRFPSTRDHPHEHFGKSTYTAASKTREHRDATDTHSFEATKRHFACSPHELLFSFRSERGALP